MDVAYGVPGMSYFKELAILIVIMLLGHWLEMSIVQGELNTLQNLASLIPNVAHRITGGEIEDVPVSELQHDDHVMVRPGEQLAADGLVIDGRNSVKEAFLTGEAVTVPKKEGSEVMAAAAGEAG